MNNKKMKEEEIPQIFCMRGNAERAEEVKAEFVKRKAANASDWGYKAEDCIYYIDHGSARCADKSNILYDLLISTQTIHELPSKELELIEGEIYATQQGEIFIYKRHEDPDIASFVVGIDSVASHPCLTISEGKNSCWRPTRNVIKASSEQKQNLLYALDWEGFVFCKETLTLEKKIINKEDVLTEEDVPRECITTKPEQFRVIANELADLYEKKNADYGDSFGETFQKLGVVSAITRMSDKLNRFTNLSLNGNQQINDEALRDTILDLAAYAIMTAIELPSSVTFEKEKKPRTPPSLCEPRTF